MAKIAIFLLTFIYLILNNTGYAQDEIRKGCISGTCGNGWGTYIFSNGRFTGEWKDGLIHGYGTYIWKTGDQYEGSWVNGKRSGFGTFTWKDGSKFEGNWFNDQRNGPGILYSNSGAVIKQGKWAENMYYKRVHGLITPCKLFIIPEKVQIHLRGTPFDTLANAYGEFVLEFPEKTQPAVFEFTSPVTFPAVMTLDKDTLVEICLNRKVRKSTLAVPIYGPVLYGKSIERNYLKAAAITDFIGLLALSYTVINYGNYKHAFKSYNSESDRYYTLNNIEEINESHQLMEDLYHESNTYRNRCIAGTITGSAFIAASVIIRIIAIASPNMIKHKSKSTRYNLLQQKHKMTIVPTFYTQHHMQCAGININF